MSVDIMHMTTVDRAHAEEARRAAEARQRAEEARRRALEHAMQAAKARAERAHANAPAAEIKKATAEAQKAAREKFLRSHPVVSPAEQRQRAEASSAAITKAARAIDSAQGDDAKRGAVLKATRTVAGELRGKTGDEAKQILESSAGALAKVSAGLDTLDRDQTKRAVSDLAAAAESAGPALAHHITDPIAKALPASLAHEGANKDELTSALGAAVDSGRGAVLATSLAASAKKVPGLEGVAKDIDDKTKHSIDASRKGFVDASKKADVLDARLAVTVDQWKKSGALSPGGIQAGIAAYKKTHHDDYAKAESAAKQLASVLPGAGAVAREPGGVGDAARAALSEVPVLARRQSGADAIAAGLEHNSGWLAESKHVLSVGAKANEQMASFDNALLRSVAVGGGALVRHGDRARLADLVRGASRAVSSDKLAGALEQYRQRINGMPPDLTGVTLGRQLAGAANTIASTTLADSNIAGASSASSSSSGGAPSVRFQALGAALGLGALAQDAITFDPNDLKSVVSAAGHAGMVGVSFASLAGKSVGNAGLAIGAAFSVFNVGEALSKGDAEGAAAASLPLVGLGIGAVVGGPVGAGIGLAAGGLVSTAISLFGHSDKRPDQIQEEAVDPFLKAAFAHDGVKNADTAAFRLRDVFTNHGSFTGVSDSLGKLATATGETPRQVLDRLAGLPSNNLRLVTTALLDAEKKGPVTPAAGRDLATLLSRIEALGDNELPG